LGLEYILIEVNSTDHQKMRPLLNGKAGTST
jgi:hypothetical protein